MPRTRVADEVGGSATADRPHLILVGMMGSGKTTVGRRLAAVLDRPFRDSDELVESRTGHTVREIFEREGEEAFRREEAAVLAASLAEDEPAVVAAAGGTVLRPENRSCMRTRGRVVWLRAPTDVLVARAGAGGHRPLLDGDPGGVLEEMATARGELYRETADLVLDVDALDPDEVVTRILEAIR